MTVKKPSKIVTLLKKRTHRLLSPQELEWAKKGRKIEKRTMWGVREMSYLMRGKEPLLEIRDSSIRTKNDFSHPEVTHKGYYIDEVVEYRYTPEGELIERKTKDFERGGSSNTRYNPPGSLKGERIKPGELEKDLTFFLAIGGLFGGIFFLSSNMTGNVIGNLNPDSYNWVGGILFILGLIGTFFLF